MRMFMDMKCKIEVLGSWRVFCSEIDGEGLLVVLVDCEEVDVDVEGTRVVVVVVCGELDVEISGVSLVDCEEVDVDVEGTRVVVVVVCGELDVEISGVSLVVE
jgi:hypothetical protein